MNLEPTSRDESNKKSWSNLPSEEIDPYDLASSAPVLTPCGKIILEAIALNYCKQIY